MTPKITDDQIELGATALCRFNGKPFHDECDPICERCKKTAAFILEAALDRRTGPKCRRVEWDDVKTYRRRVTLGGRRKTDAGDFTGLPKKSARLARESAEKSKRASPEEEIPVSEGMREAGASAFQAYRNFSRGTISGEVIDALCEAYRAMRRKELEAAPSGASCAAKTETGARAETTTGFSVRRVQYLHARAGDDGMSTNHRRKTDAE